MSDKKPVAKSIHEFPDQRVRNNEKQKEDWYIRCTNYIIDRAMSANNKADTITNFEAANGNIDFNSIKYALFPYSKDVSNTIKQTRFPNTIRNIDIITPIKERYLGEFIKQYHNYQVFIHDADSVFARSEALDKAVKSVMLKAFQKAIETGSEEGIQQLDIEKFAKKFIEEWVDERVIKGQKRLDLLNSLTDATVKYIQAFFFWWATEEVYSYRTIVSNEVEKEIIPPWEYYRIDSGNLFVEDDDMGMRKYKMSINQIIDTFRDKIKPEDLTYIKTLLDKHSDTDTITVPHHMISSRTAFDIYNTGTVAAQHNLDITDSSRMLNVYHCVWKTETMIKRLKYLDFITGEVAETEVEQDYKLDEAAGDISIEIDWVNEVVQTWRFGGRDEGIYLPLEPVEVQRQEVNNTSVCKLPYNGITGLLKYNQINPIPKRLIVYQELLKLYHYQREKAIAKFKTFNIIPESLLLDSDEMTMEERFTYAAIDDILPFNDTDVEPSILQAIKNLYNQGAERYIQILSEVIESLKREAMDTANMNEQRYGDINQQAGKSVTEYAITKATTGSILMFEMFNKFRERDYMADLDYSKAAWIDGKRGSFIDPNTKEVVYVDIDGIEELGTNLGVFIKNSALEEEKLKMYRELAFAASQGGKFGLAADAIHSENSTELRRLIKKAEEADREYEMNTQKSAEALQAQLADKQEYIEQMKMLHEKEIVQMKEDASNQRKLAELDVKIQELNMKFAEATDTDIMGEYKQEMDRANMEIKQRKLELDQLKVEMQQVKKPE